MTPQLRSSHPLLSCADGVAAGMTDTLLLIGRILIAALFLMTVWFGSPNVGYLTSINVIRPDVVSPLARVIEWVIVISLIFGLGTRYGTLLALIFVVLATVAAHRWWSYPQAAQLVQYTFLTKNIAVAGGLIALFVTGGGRFSVDAMLASDKRAAARRTQSSEPVE
ncbi:MAG TPA: DoxX family protein [Terriglobales bacterium]|jgi:putative oxidoreductase